MTERPNILLITADDMNWDAVGAFGCRVAGTTPNIDRLAADGMAFDEANVTISVCQPSRSSLLTGRYPHRSGGEGFYHLRKPNVPILPEVLGRNGYRTGILGKVEHSSPYAEYRWDLCHDIGALGHGRNPQLYGQYTQEFIKAATESQQPFFLMLNSHDPHRPFYGNDDPRMYVEGDKPAAAIPSRVFTAEEIITPGFLEDLPEVRREVAEYYSSVRRCDDTVGAVLRVLEESGMAENTIVVFLSDNGMSFPFAKTNCYLNSTKTPWIVRWPGKIQPGTREGTHFISGIDLMPTLLDAVGIDGPANMDGESFLPLLQGEAQSGRDLLFTQFHQTFVRRNYPIRCVQNQRYGYIFNPWSDGERKFKNESQSGRTMKAMREAAKQDAQIAERVQLFVYRVPEEFYDLENDPDCRNNLIDEPELQSEIDSLRVQLEQWMVETEDPALEAFRHRHSPQALQQFMDDLAVALPSKH
ncbi:sulfatase family protein [Coraliomargarita parva]|uniref:sulfatase family protein n=1 Tax=Coraliomargarita parva TaxID=3014050 RepID=UPI0022B4535B|nr:sulfatase [Coraliomargarita parva]